MSADTSIWVAKFPRGWRTTWVIQAIDNIERYKEHRPKKEYEKYLEDMFLPEIYSTKAQAVDKAVSIEEKFNREDDLGLWLEYGIVELGEI